MAKQTIAEVVANLESQVAFFREREALHAQQEAYHREQRDAFAAELEKVTRHLEAFQAVAGTAVELAARSVVPPAVIREENLGSASRPRLGKMVELVIADLDPETRFGVKTLAVQVNRRFGERLRNPIDERQISVVLRRMSRMGRLELVRPGRPHWEALYVRAGG